MILGADGGADGGGRWGFFRFVSVFEAFESGGEIWSDSPNHSFIKMPLGLQLGAAGTAHADNGS